MTKLAPGVYDDGIGMLHVDVPEFLAAHGFAPTPANCEQLARVAQQMVEDRFGIRVEVTADPVEEN
jgi:hypothetical protein